MKILFNSDRTHIDEVMYIKDGEIEYAISEGESIDINSPYVTSYTKAHVKLTLLSKILLFLKRFIINLFNIIIMNFPNKWYKDVEPYVFKPVTIDLSKSPQNIIEIKVVCSKFDLTTRIIEKPKLFVNNELISSEVTFDKESINLSFLTYIYDMISLLFYACAPVSVIFLYSGKMEIPVMIVIYSVIILIICIPILCKCVCAYKEKKEFEKCI